MAKRRRGKRVPTVQLRKKRQAAWRLYKRALKEVGAESRRSAKEIEKRVRAALVPKIQREFAGVKTKAHAKKIAERVPLGLVTRKQATANVRDPTRGWRHIKGKLWRRPNGRLANRTAFRRSRAQTARWEEARLIAKAAGVSVREADAARALVRDDVGWRAEEGSPF